MPYKYSHKLAGFLDPSVMKYLPIRIQNVPFHKNPAIWPTCVWRESEECHMLKWAEENHDTCQH